MLRQSNYALLQRRSLLLWSPKKIRTRKAASLWDTREGVDVGGDNVSKMKRPEDEPQSEPEVIALDSRSQRPSEHPQAAAFRDDAQLTERREVNTNITETIQSVLRRRQEVHDEWSGGLRSSSATTGPGVASATQYEAADRIERRRARPSVSDAEFDLGMSERLFPELPRLQAVSELHHSDCVVSSWCEDTVVGWLSKDEEKAAVVEPVSERIEKEEEEGSFLADDFNDDDIEQQRLSAQDAAPTSSVAAPDGITMGATKLVRSVETFTWLPTGRSGKITLPPLSAREIDVLHKYLCTLRGIEANRGRRLATWSDLMGFLSDPDGGLRPPVQPFSCRRGTVSAPAWVFYLYTENTSTQNALGHICALFSLPQTSFITSAVASKMSAATVLCAVHSNCMTEEQILLLNTMRHPGFVIRTAGAQAVHNRSDEELFSEMSRLQTISEVSLLLRRVHGTRRELQQRLEALQNVGGIFFCANRELSLVRAATDVIHGYHRSAFLNALYRRKASTELRRFLANPTVQSASYALRAATDSSVKQMLKRYIATGGNFKKAVMQTPHVLRRRWINALRCIVWNTMAATRFREVKGAARLRVVIGDLILKPEFRADAQLRKMPNIKAMHLMVCRTQEEADAATLEDVFLPFFKGKFPVELFAAEDSGHPVMTKRSMWSILSRLHAKALLSGMSEEAKRVLDIRADGELMLFRRLVMRPVGLHATLLEDRAPVRSLQYDASRVLLSPRMIQTIGAEAVDTNNGASGASGTTLLGEESVAIKKVSEAEGDREATGLVSRKYILGHSSFAAHAGVSNRNAPARSESFFSIPSREDYVVLGRAQRDLDGQYVLRAPLAEDVAEMDRVYTVHIRALCVNGASGLLSLLREYFSLSGVLSEEDAALQHKVHRTRRELDPETPLLCSEQFCPACYNRCHDDVQVCAEYQFKKAVQQEEALRRDGVSASSQRLLDGKTRDVSLPAGDAMSSMRIQEGPPLIPSMSLTIRRHSATDKWGIILDKDLVLQRIDEPDRITELQWSCSPEVMHVAVERLNAAERERRSVGDDGDAHMSYTRTTLAALLTARRLSASTPESLRECLNCIGVGDAAPSDLLKCLQLRVVSVNGAPVSTRRELAAAFLLGKQNLAVTIAMEPDRTSIESAFEALRLIEAPSGERDDERPSDASCFLPTREVLQRLPREVQLIISRVQASGEGDSKPQASWGFSVSGNTMALLNLGKLLETQLKGYCAKDADGGGLAVVCVPPISTESLLSGAPAGVGVLSLAPLYKIGAVNGVPVDTIEALGGVIRTVDYATGTVSLHLHKLPVEELLQHASTTQSRTSEYLQTQQMSTQVDAGQAEQESRSDISTIPWWVSLAAAAVPQLPLLQPNHALLVASELVGGIKARVEPFVVSLHRAPALVESRRWGIRLQRGTCRLKALPDRNREDFYSSVFCSSLGAAAARAIADTLQQSSDSTGGEEIEVARSVPFVFAVVGVGQHLVKSASELQDALRASTSESTTLQCVRIPLPAVVLRCRRALQKSGDTGEGADTSRQLSWGLALNQDLVLQTVQRDSPCYEAIESLFSDAAVKREQLASLASLLSPSQLSRPTIGLAGGAPSLLNVDDDEVSGAAHPKAVAVLSESVDTFYPLESVCWKLVAVAAKGDAGVEEIKEVTTTSEVAHAMRDASEVSLRFQQVASL